jgi:hypothetical protein
MVVVLEQLLFDDEVVMAVLVHWKRVSLVNLRALLGWVL